MARAKILVVDDEANILDLVTAYLKPEGYEVRTAADGATGLDLARSFQPDVIVLDVMLPGIDGLEVLARLRRESGAYVILLTSKSEETDKWAFPEKCLRKEYTEKGRPEWKDGSTGHTHRNSGKRRCGCWPVAAGVPPS